MTSLLVVATLVKFIVAPLLLLWLWSLWRDPSLVRRGRTIAVHLLVTAAIAAAAFAPFLNGWRTFESLAGAASREGWASGPALVARGIRALVRSLGAAGVAHAAGTATTAAFLALFGILAILLLARARADRPGPAWGSAMVLLALSGPYLLPWYVAWFAPLLAAVADNAVVLIGLAMSAVLALTGIPAEPGSTPGLWRGMVLGVHDGAAALMLVLLAAAVVRTITRAGRHTAPP